MLKQQTFNNKWHADSKAYFQNPDKRHVVTKGSKPIRFCFHFPAGVNK